MPRSGLLAVVLLLLAAAILWSCQQGKPQPVEIVLSEDSCAECRMAVSVKKFAAEIVSPGGHTDYYDDIGCLLLALKAHAAPTGAAIYVVDFDTGQWLDAASAYYLQAQTLPTPMSYGLAAFGTRAAAEAQLKSWPGKVLGWLELQRGFKP
jgi:copper chaperone NosL